MSIVGMRKFFQKPIRMRVGRKHLSFGSPVAIIFWAFVVIFVVASYYSFGPAGSRAREAAAAAAGQGTRKVSKVIATVGDYQIMRTAFEAHLADMGLDDMPLAQQAQTKLQTLQQMINQQLELAAVKKQNITVGSDEVQARRAQDVEQAIAMRFPDKRELKKYLQDEKLGYDQFKQKIANEQFGDLDTIRHQLEIEKLQNTIEGRVTVSDQELTNYFTDYHAQHILITPSGQKARDEAKAKAAKQSLPANYDADAAAKKEAQDLLAQIQKGADFSKLAKEYSDDPGSAKNGGDVGWFSPSEHKMVPEFTEATEALKPGQVSGVVKTQYGYHIIKLLATRPKLPKDFAKKKEQYRQQVVEGDKQEAWSKFMDQLHQENPTVFVDPELKGYQELDKQQNDAAMVDLAKAVKDDPTAMPARYILALLYRQKKDNQQAADVLRQVTDSDEGAKYPEAHMLLGDLYVALGKKSDAVAQYRNASDRAMGGGSDDQSAYIIHMELEQKFAKLGRKDLAAAEKQWIKDFTKRQQQNGGMGMGGTPMSIPVK